MKTVYYTRHAKSSWENEALTDKQRPLNARGKKDAPAMAEELANLLHKTDAQINGILSSTSQRTRETLVPFAEKFALQPHVIYDDQLYHAPSYLLVESLFQLPDDWDSCQLFAHNPGITILLNELSSSMIQNVPTCGIFKVEFPVTSWQEVDINKAKLGFFIFPKMFQK